MSGVLSRSRVSSEQLDVLLSFMEEHPEFAAGKLSVYSRFTSSKLWRLLAERLNAAAGDSGGAHKSPDKWCRYWADIKYKARKKAAASGALGDLSSAEERVQSIFHTTTRDSGGCSGGGGGCAGGASDSEERKPSPLEADMCSEGGGAGSAAGGEAPRLATEELLAEAAMRSALAAEKQAEAVSQAVELLRELVALLRERAPTHLAPAHLAPAHHAPDHAPDHLAPLHHHRL